MISVQNLLQRLNGNKLIILFFLSFLVLSCSSSFRNQRVISNDTLQKTSNIKGNNIKDSLKLNLASTVIDTVFLKKQYNVALILPLFIDSINLKDDDDKYVQSEMALSFYEGALLAIDSFNQQGLNIQLFIFDSENNVTKVKNILAHPEMKKMDYLIGPIYTDNIKIAAKLAKDNNIPFISPLSPDTGLSYPNPYHIMLTPSIITHCNIFANYMLNKYETTNILILRDEDQNQDELLFTQYFKKAFEKENKQLDGVMSLTDMVKSRPEALEIEEYLSLTEDNLIYMPSLDEAYVYYIFTQLKILLKDYKIVIMGLPVWLQFESISIDYFEQLQVHLTNNYFVNHDNHKSTDFRNRFLKRYKAEPSKFAYQGYDIFSYFWKVCSTYGISFEYAFKELKWEGLTTKFNIKPILINGAIQRFENAYVHILRFKDYDIITIDDY